MEALSLELGVAAPHLEEELQVLVQKGLLRTLSGGRYQTDIVIFTGDFEKELAQRIGPMIDASAGDFVRRTQEALPALHRIGFSGNDAPDQHLVWIAATITLERALNLHDAKTRERFGDYPQLASGEHGFSSAMTTTIRTTCTTASTAIVRTKLIPPISVCSITVPSSAARSFSPTSGTTALKQSTTLSSAKRRTKKRHAAPSHCRRFHLKRRQHAAGAIPCLYATAAFAGAGRSGRRSRDRGKVTQEVCAAAEDLMRLHAPKALSEKSAQLCHIKYGMDTGELLVKAAVCDGLLVVPEADAEKPYMYGVRR